MFKAIFGLLFVISIANSSVCQAEEVSVGTAYGSEKVVSIYMAQWCPHCIKAKDYLNTIGVEYNVYDIETPEGQDKYNALDMAQGVPIITVGQLRMDGFSAQQLNMMLCDSGVITNCNNNT